MALVLLVALVLPHVARGQESLPTGRVDAAFQPSSLDVPLGGVANGSLVLRNGKLQPVTVTLSAPADARYQVRFLETEILLPPASNRTVQVLAYPSATLGLGAFNVTVRVRDEGAAGVAAGGATDVNLTVRLVDAPLPRGSPIVSPRVLGTLELGVNESGTALVTLRHDAADNRSFRVRAYPPAGWTITSPGARLVPGQSGWLTLNATSPLPRNGTALVVVEDVNDASLATVLHLPLAAKPRAPANSTRTQETSSPPPPPPQEEAQEPDPSTTWVPPPEDEEDAAGTDATPAEDPPVATQEDPLPEEDPAPSPPPEDAPAEEPPPPVEEDAAAAPPPPVQAAPALPEPDARPPPQPEEAPPEVAFRVEPRILRVPPGGAAEARLVVTSDRDARVPLRLELPLGLASDLLTRTVDVKAGVPLVVPFLVEADARLTDGARLDARVVAEDREAPFVVLIEHAFEPVALVSLSAPTSAGGQGLAAAPSWLPWLLAGIGASALAFSRSRGRWLVLAAALYARLRPQAVLDHPVRQRLALLAEERPGRSIRDLQRDLGLANGAMTYHLRTLEKAGLLRVVPDGNMRRVYPATHARVAPVPPLADRILHHVHAHGEATTKDLAEALGTTRQAVHYHLQKLTREGRLRATVTGRETRFRTPEPPAPLPRPTGT